MKAPRFSSEKDALEYLVTAVRTAPVEDVRDVFSKLEKAGYGVKIFKLPIKKYKPGRRYTKEDAEMFTDDDLIALHNKLVDSFEPLRGLSCDEIINNESLSALCRIISDDYYHFVDLFGERYERLR